MRVVRNAHPLSTTEISEALGCDHCSRNARDPRTIDLEHDHRASRTTRRARPRNGDTSRVRCASTLEAVKQEVTRHRLHQRFLIGSTLDVRSPDRNRIGERPLVWNVGSCCGACGQARPPMARLSTNPQLRPFSWTRSRRRVVHGDDAASRTRWTRRGWAGTASSAMACATDPPERCGSRAFYVRWPRADAVTPQARGVAASRCKVRCHEPAAMVFDAADRSIL